MDPLDRLAGPGADLLRRVDDTLVAAGAPDDHRIWPLLRRLRALPGEAVAAVAALHPAPLAEAGGALRTRLPEYEDARAALAREVSWQGAGAEAYAAQRDALAAYLTAGPESLAGRLSATAGYAAALGDWVTASRGALARTVAEVLGSAEAVALLPGAAEDGPASAAPAAAEIGARVLTTVAEAYDRAEALLARWAPRLGEVDFRPPAGTAARFDLTTRVEG
ncbi:hypothetical protein AB0J86_36520 [Micromonospora sp. NPDC049559]|uniref:hypothetical protein n=1 Tax=Micromonospora sp. NPDC049559 TaxID=3155923 RepID=UPI00343BA00F